ncbi:MAG: cbb3-type cytochrome oxidase subunit 3 [Pontibacterium sp.]
MSYEVYGPFIPVVMLTAFILMFIWVLLPKNKKRFDEASQLPFADEEKDIDSAANGRDKK